MRFQLILKLVLLGAMVVGFGIALLWIWGIVSERQSYRDRVTAEVAQSTARSQKVNGPVLIVHYRERGIRASRADSSVVRGEVTLRPESLEVHANVRVEQRSRGIYKVQVYRATQTLTGVFRVPARLGLPEARDILEAEPGRLAVGVSDARGLRRPPVVRWGGEALEVEPGTGEPWLQEGFWGNVGQVFGPEARRIPFEIDLELVGTEQLGLVPVAGSTKVVMESDWPHPSFTGDFLPDERTVTSKGFRATWQLSRFSTGGNVPVGTTSNAVPELAVRMIQPVDVYQQSTRAVKYGMLFVLLTFLVFLLYEVLKRLAVHPVQYGLAGAAVALFFLLLVSLSEHIPFAVAYLVASAGCVGLLAFYVAHVLHSVVRGMSFAALVALLYGVLYVLLLSEDYALLLGSLLLFGVLAVVMFITRRVDWYRVGEGAPAPERSGGVQ